MCEMIVTKSISKQFGNLMAVDNLSIQVKQGEIYGFIGLNGAGKTTLIRMLLGMTRPTEGECYLNGKKITRAEYKIWAEVGYMVETPYAYPELTVWENLQIVRRLRLLPRHAVAWVIDGLNLTRYKHTKAGQLSLGNAQRLGIAKALIHRPKILLLDEPMNGLDPEGIVEIRELLRELAINEGVTIFISSHILSEIAQLATRIGIIHEGKLVKDIEVNSLKSHLNRQLIIQTKNNDTAQKLLTNAGYTPVLKENALEIKNERALHYPEKVATLLVESGTPPVKLFIYEESLEDFFLHVIHSTESGVSNG